MKNSASILLSSSPDRFQLTGFPLKIENLRGKWRKKKNWENVGKKCRTSWNVLVVCGHDHFQLTGLPLKLPVSATGREEVNREGNVWESGDSLRENCEKLPLRKTVEILYKRKVCKVFFSKKLRFSTWKENDRRVTSDKCCIHCGKENNENCNTNKSQKIEFKLFEQNTKTAKNNLFKSKI